MKKFTKEEKQKYFQQLRVDWQKSKELAQKDEMQGIIREVQAAMITGTRISAGGICYVWEQMKKIGLEGLPVIDCKTFLGWKDSGFKVKKGEHSKIHGITWISPENEENEIDVNEKKYTYPKVYHLFHRSQVEPLA